ncbi:cytohesin-interacting protein-like isoform X2 [Ostrea edulis]|uniref:cytohesin-interacting protein-like isoform X2 n=1 Tax=Ostrea edulis TaxID=37623 RepID=UPI0024AF0EAD|nr:cytohesin-interacting protein-like isoform X2 [Ostrea edulis]
MNTFCLDRKKPRMLKPIQSVGADLDHLEAERSILSDPQDNRKRRTILLHKKNESWGFTIQTYGFKNKKTGEIEVYTYVDYVALNGPANIAGMRRGDIILSVNGRSVEFATHQELVSVIQSCGDQARLVVLFVDCCKKVELHDRLIKLKRLLNLKIKELRDVEMKERELLDEFCFTRGLDRFDYCRQSILSTQSNESSLDRISILTANSNLHNIPNTVTLHLNASSSFSNTSKSSSDELSDCAYDVDSFADVNYADDSDGDSGYSNEDFPGIQRRNTVIERRNSGEDVRNRRETLVAVECECEGDRICRLCEIRQQSESMDMPLSEGSEDATPVMDSDSSLVHTPNPESNPDCIPGSEKPEQVSCELNDCADLVQSNPDDSSPAGQVISYQDSSETEPDTAMKDDWDFPFWTEGAICINLDDEDTKL